MTGNGIHTMVLPFQANPLLSIHVPHYIIARKNVNTVYRVRTIVKNN